MMQGGTGIQGFGNAQGTTWAVGVTGVSGAPSGDPVELEIGKVYKVKSSWTQEHVKVVGPKRTTQGAHAQVEQVRVKVWDEDWKEWAANKIMSASQTTTTVEEVPRLSAAILFPVIK